MTWTAEGSCYHGVRLRTVADDQLVETLVSEILEGPGQGETYLYGLEPTRYYLSANSGCSAWSFTFAPQ